MPTGSRVWLSRLLPLVMTARLFGWTLPPFPTLYCPALFPAGRLERRYAYGAKAIIPVTERRRSRTDRAWGYHTAQVLKTCWATGPVPLRG